MFKSGDSKVFNNYRPVSLLSQFSKILEKLFNIRLINYINKNNILYEGQYGFRKNHSTALALFDFIEKLTSAIDKKKITVGVFIDLRKAFDTIDHEILLKKLNMYGIRGIPLLWITSYLNNRMQYVHLDDAVSGLLTVICGVPQGSVLGPTLFLLYINDLPNVSEILSYILFADDTNIFYTGDDIYEICNILSNELKKLDIWFRVNKLSLNVSKTNFIVFSNLKCGDCNIEINGSEIERVYSTKFLGIYIDSKLSWENQIKQVQNKVAKSISIMYKVKYLLDKTSLYTLYCSLVLPYLNYCCEIWANNYYARIRNIIVLQKKAIRIVDQVPYKSHTSEIFKKYRLLKFQDIVKVSTCLVMYKAKHNLLPRRLNNIFTLNTGCTRQAGKFVVNFRRTTLKTFCISSVGVKLWNELDDRLYECNSLSQFKRRYKNCVIESY